MSVMCIAEGELRRLLDVGRSTLFLWRRRGLKQITAGAPGLSPTYDLLDVRAFLQATGYGSHGRCGKLVRFDALVSEIKKRDPRLGLDLGLVGNGRLPSEGEVPSDAEEPRGSDGLLLASRARREHFLSKQAQLDYLRQIGELVSVAEVREVALRRYRALRDKFLNIPERVASVIAAEADPGRCHKLLTDEIKRVLSELADGARAEAGQQKFTGNSAGDGAEDGNTEPDGSRSA